jgi:hypothetical protein
MVSQFFRLPRELRDQIYEYSLTDARGLFYQTCSNGVSKLCTKQPKPSLRSIIMMWLSVYRHSSLYVTRTCITCRHENNQLKYVCRRLHYETMGLDLRYNTVVFEDTVVDALERCITVLRRHSTLHTVAIKCSLPSFANNYHSGKFSAISQYCTAHPNLLVKIYIPYWSQTSPNFVSLGLNFLYSLRQDGDDATRLAELVSYPSGALSEDTSIYEQTPSNLRFYPREEKFNQHVFERCCLENPLIRLPTTPNNTNDMLQLVGSWFETGL